MANNDGLRFTIPNGQFRRTLGIVSYPILTNLQGNFYLGGTLDASARNQGPIGPDAEEVGLVDVSNPYAMRVQGLAEQALVTGITDTTNDMTIVGVVRNDQMPTVIMGNLSGNDPRDGSFSVSLDNSGRHEFRVTNASASVGVIAPDTLPMRYVFLAGVVSGTTVSAFSGVDGVVKKASAPAPFTRLRNSAVPINIGQGAYNLSGNVDRDFYIAQMSFHSSALPDANIASIYRFLRSFYARVGIAI
jgi:hypothetical protein